MALFVDESSMVARAQWFQADLRLKQAKREFARRFGGVAMVTTGDLLQLPPVQRDSVCDPRPEKSNRKVTADDEEQPKKKRRTAEEQKEAEAILHQLPCVGLLLVEE